MILSDGVSEDGITPGNIQKVTSTPVEVNDTEGVPVETNDNISLIVIIAASAIAGISS